MALLNLAKFSLFSQSQNLPKNCMRIVLISTSKKSKDTVSIADSIKENITPGEQFKSKEKLVHPKNWVNYGFSKINIVDDNTRMHLIFFMLVTMCLVGGGFLVCYMPDQRMANWSKREAFLELRRREALGLLPVDPDYVPRENLNLPVSDEELEALDVPIII